MSDAESSHSEQDTEHCDGNGRRGVDPISLIAGILVLLAAAYVLSGGPAWLSGIDLRWIVAGGAVLAGTLMLGASIRRGRG